MKALDWILLGAGGLLTGYCILATVMMGPVRFNALLAAAGVLLIALAFLDRRFGALPGAVCFKRVAVPIAAVLLLIFAGLEPCLSSK